MSIESPRLSRAVAQLPNQPQVADAPTAALSSTDLKIGQLIPVEVIGIIASYIHPNGRNELIGKLCEGLQATPVEKAQVIEAADQDDSLETQQKEVQRIVYECNAPSARRLPLPTNGKVYTAAVSVHLESTFRATGEVIRFLREKCPNMLALSINSFDISDSLLNAIAQCKSLKKLSVVVNSTRNESLSIEGFLALRSLTQLESFSTNLMFYNMETKIATDFLSAFPQLRELHVDMFPFEKRFLCELGSCPCLERLHIGHVKEEELAILSRIPSLCQKLQELRVITLGPATQDYYQYFDAFKNLNKLIVNDTCLAPVSSQALQALKQLEHPCALFPTFATLSDLEEVVLDDAVSPSQMSAFLTASPRLRALNLAVSNRFSSEENSNWFPAPSTLETLNLRVEKFDLSLVEGLKQARNLRSLKLCRTGSRNDSLNTDEVLCAIASHLPKLRELEIYLDRNKGLTDKGFSALLSCKKLEKVVCDLRGVAPDTIKTVVQQHECLLQLTKQEDMPKPHLFRSNNTTPTRLLKNSTGDSVVVDQAFLGEPVNLNEEDSEETDDAEASTNGILSDGTFRGSFFDFLRTWKSHTRS